jgi:signal transduction histidine kinase
LRSDPENVRLHGPRDAYRQLDRDALSEIIEQVMTNASRFRQANSTISIQLQRNGEHAEIRIANLGPNIPEEHLEDIFEYGVSLGEKTTAENLGQGLAVARARATRVNGTICARNLPGGVAFDIQLPVVEP